MSTQSFTYDARIPIGANVTTDSPEHPRNVVRNSLMIQNQATADTRYDIYPPPRVDGFVGSKSVPTDLSFFVGIAVITLCLIGLLNFSQTPVRVLLILIVLWAIHHSVGRLEH